MNPVKLQGDSIYNLIQVLMVLEERKMRCKNIDFIEMQQATGMEVKDLFQAIKQGSKLRLVDASHCNYYKNNGIISMTLTNAESTRLFLKAIYSYALNNEFGNSTEEIIELLRKAPYGHNYRFC